MRMKILYLRFALAGLLFKGGFVSNMRIKFLNLRFCAAGFLFKGGLVSVCTCMRVVCDLRFLG